MVTQSLDEFNDSIGTLDSFLMGSNYNHYIIVGDFNRSDDSRFMELLKGFAYEHILTFSDMIWLLLLIVMMMGCMSHGLTISYVLAKLVEGLVTCMVDLICSYPIIFQSFIF